MTTLSDLLDTLAERFAAAELEFGHGTDNPWDEAVALCLGVLGWSDDAANLHRDLPVEVAGRIHALAEQRITQRIPLPLLLGRCVFAGHEFNVAPNVMIPRSPFAELIRAGFSPWLSQPPKRILDVCTGGGCIGIACALRWPSAQVVLAELDPAACELAATNVTKHAVADRVTLVQGDLFEPIDSRFDLIVSNPPYVPSLDTAARGDEFRHEPDLAYDGGADGMVLVARMLVQAGDYLAAQGSLFVEVGQYRAELETRYPRLPFVWPELLAGGEGVFLLTAKELVAAKELAEHTGQLRDGDD